MEQCLVQSCEKFVAELEDKHKAELEHERSRLLNKHSEEMNALHAKHKAQLDSLGACHRDQLAAMVKELDNKHKAELVALESALDSKRMEDLKKLEAAFKETSQAQLEALEAELAHRHQEERDELEKRMLGNMDTLEATYLKEVQVSRDKPFNPIWLSLVCTMNGSTQTFTGQALTFFFSSLALHVFNFITGFA